MEIVSICQKPGAARLLIVSTFKTRCGMASHTEVLISHLSDSYSIDVFPLDQVVLRSRDRRAVEAGNRAIRQMCRQMVDYDAVILQWEPGFWGVTSALIIKRVKMFTESVHRLIMVTHTVMPESAVLNYTSIKSVANESGVSAAFGYVKEAISGLYSRLYNCFRAVDRRGELTVIAHTRRDRRFLEIVVGFSDVRDHPLFHMQSQWKDTIEADVKAARHNLEENYGKDSVFVSTFGFLTAHKSFETAVTAMRFLPKNYKLLIYGGIHPNSIVEREPINPYVKSLTAAATGNVGALMKYAPTGIRPPLAEDGAATNEAIKSIFYQNLPIDERIIFMGSPDDYGFAVAIGACDVAVLPYLEIGQSASGPASQIMELGVRLVSTTARPFAELERLFPDRINMFDIGNYMQLAVAIKNSVAKPKHESFALQPNSWTQREFYVNAIDDMVAKGGKSREVAA